MKNFSLPIDKNIFVGIDVGSSKICCTISGIDPIEGTFQLLGIGTSSSSGVKMGSITHRDNLISEMEIAMREAETMAGAKVDSAIISISSEQIRGINTQGAIAIQKNQMSNVPIQHEITESDIQKVVDLAKGISLPIDRDILHVLPQEYMIDTLDKIKDPVGMSGHRLEAHVHLITVGTTAATNVANCAQELGIVVDGLVFQGLASGAAVLDQDEKDLGVALVDLGEGTSDLAIYHEGGIRHTSVLGIGSGNITNDIAVMLQVGMEEAKQIKETYGSAKASMSSPELEFDLPVKNGGLARKISEHELSRYVEARTEEILRLVKRDIIRAGLKDNLTYGVVLTGGGANLKNIIGLAEEVLELPVRIGKPKGIQDSVGVASDPQFSAAVGLGIWRYRPDELQSNYEIESPIQNTMRKVIEWFKDFF
ncbi:MAG: cell division protein FtsA [Candidatus Marinimicrobia bacterium]|nr:cell division protein FtsA [Candidatus Neomarinimicrobiota bacterium]MBT3997893.1 cell division protein FtsA [Candidatus Neomarinimicrobiota bacterium]MBT4281271.1 cell division protein FtsA [Candidatus Neomarinimicrobiota bacterium]MBT4569120.1 cell division protein FtsA [Candidatus Neomarinimicrobiota bacterium]MBT4794865.1 cell division protein FtsA [Candidatus Neomarinimicrobiota bacterium]